MLCGVVMCGLRVLRLVMLAMFRLRLRMVVMMCVRLCSCVSVFHAAAYVYYVAF